MSKIILPALLCCLLPLNSMAAADESTEQRLKHLESTIGKLQNRITVLERKLNQRQSNTSIGSSSSNNVYVCRLKIFSDTYKGESTNQGQAKRQVQQACLKDHQTKFCDVDKISCDRY